MKLKWNILISFCLFQLMASGQAELGWISVASGFSAPVGLANAGDGSERLFVVEKGGVIKIIDDIPSGNTLATPFLNISATVSSGPEQGLLGLDFHPNYPDSPYFYVNYTFVESNQIKTKIERYTVTADPNVADPNSGLCILKQNQPYHNHNAGDIKFGPDGFLYITMGDGGSARDPDSVSQNKMSLLGSLLRLDINSDDFPGDPEANYRIPPSNPFVGDVTARDEFWAIGLRNPWRIAFDRTTGDLWIADVGQDDREELNKQLAASSGGENYGWSCKEGFLTVNYNMCIPGPLTDPVFEYTHSDGISVTGGFVYRGAAFPNLDGYYLFTDYGTGNFWSLNSTNFADVTMTSFIGGVTAFGESESGEMYLTHFGSGTIYRIVDTTVCPGTVDIMTHVDSLYTADTLISSNATVNPGPEIEYYSPDIELNPDFTVDQNGLFKAVSKSCIAKLISETY